MKDKISIILFIVINFACSILCMEEEVSARFILDEMNDAIISNWKERKSNFVEVQERIIKHIQQFLDQGNDVNGLYRKKNPMTFLHMSVLGLPVVVKYLVLYADADINKKLKNKSPLHSALAYSDPRGFHSIKACFDNKKDCKKIVEFLLTRNNIDVMCFDDTLVTPLHLACEFHGTVEGFCYKKIIKTFIKKGANPDVKDSTGKTPRNNYDSVHSDLNELMQQEESEVFIINREGGKVDFIEFVVMPNEKQANQ